MLDGRHGVPGLARPGDLALPDWQMQFSTAIENIVLGQHFKALSRIPRLRAVLKTPAV